MWHQFAFTLFDSWNWTPSLVSRWIWYQIGGTCFYILWWWSKCFKAIWWGKAVHLFLPIRCSTWLFLFVYLFWSVSCLPQVSGLSPLLHTDLDKGICGTHEDIRRRRNKFGSNEYPLKKERNFWVWWLVQYMYSVKPFDNNKIKAFVFALLIVDVSRGSKQKFYFDRVGSCCTGFSAAANKN